MNRPFVAENTRERERLRSMIERLTDADLKLPLGDDWTVAVALAHLSFWDQRSLFLLRKWKQSGVEPSPIDMDIINDSLLSQWLAIPLRKAADLAILSAEAVDRELENIPSEMVTAIEGIGEKYRLYRCIHRKLHLDQIEALLNSDAAT
jgi:hypothetical protein